MPSRRKSPKRPLMLWGSSHPTLAREEIPLLLEAGFRVLPMLTDMWTVEYKPAIAKDLEVGWRDSVDLPEDIITKLQAVSFYRNHGRDPLDPDELRLLECYVDTIYVTIYPNVAINLAKAFNGAVVFRAFGCPLQTYSNLATHYGGNVADLAGLTNYIWCPILSTLQEREDLRICANGVHLSCFVSPERLGVERWDGPSSQPVVMDTIPRLHTSYYLSQYEAYIRDYGTLPLEFLGGNAENGGPIGDSRIIGRLADENYYRKIRSARLSIYHGTSRYHLHYHPLEYLALGVPTLFHRHSAIAAEARLAGITDEELYPLGMFDRQADARNFAVDALRDWRVAAALSNRQPVLLEKVFHRKKALQQARWLRTVCENRGPRTSRKVALELESSRELPSTWCSRFGYFRMEGDAIVPPAETLSLATLRDKDLVDVAVSARIELTQAKHAYGGVIARYRGPEDTNALLAMLGRDNDCITVDLWRHDGKHWNLFFSKEASRPQGTVGLRADGKGVTLYFDGEPIHRVEDSTAPESGGVGIRGFGSRILHFHHEPIGESLTVKTAARPLRIGVWCDFGKTLTPHEGIGVFVHNLAAGFLAQPTPVELSLVVHPGEAAVMDELKRVAPDRVRVIESKWAMQSRRWVRGALRRYVQFSDRAQRRMRRDIPGPLGIVDKQMRKLWARPQMLVPESYHELIREAACDVWLIPYIGFEFPIDFPAVVFVHDLVIYHYPEMFDAGFVENLKRVVSLRAREATFCACMSDFIRQKDLFGVLGLPPSKVRMVRPAAPRDPFPETAPAPVTKHPYLFYPAAFRGYKNHRALILALSELEKLGIADYDVVFTGPNVDGLPRDLDALARKLGVRDRIHVTGRIDRATLGGYFRGAFAVAVPSIYEQASFPVYEALALGVPVICADIPSLREQCGPLGNAMLYFDATDAASLARTIVTLRADREKIARAQRAQSAKLTQRTWADAASEWLPVFREAAGFPSTPEKSTQKITVTSPQNPRPKAFLFLPCRYLGGVWEASKGIAAALHELSRERKSLDITFGIAPEQMRQARAEMENDVPLCAVNFTTVSGNQRECTFHWGEAEARSADVWLALSDRFEKPLRPDRPYGVVVYDALDRTEGGHSTILEADRLFVSGAHTLEEMKGLVGNRARLLPVACDPSSRFDPLCEEVSPGLEHFILNVANASEHKGLETLLKAQCVLINKLLHRCPALVVCGYGTEIFSRHSPALGKNEYGQKIRGLLQNLQLVENRDVFFLGYVTDAKLKSLFSRAVTVVNAARADNGSFSLIEAHYFGKPVISSDYPASRELYRRFGLPVSFFPVGDENALAEAVVRALAVAERSGTELDELRERLAEPTLGYGHLAEKIYDDLIQMANEGRSG